MLRPPYWISQEYGYLGGCVTSGFQVSMQYLECVCVCVRTFKKQPNTHVVHTQIITPPKDRMKNQLHYTRGFKPISKNMSQSQCGSGPQPITFTKVVVNCEVACSTTLHCWVVLLYSTKPRTEHNHPFTISVCHCRDCEYSKPHYFTLQTKFPYQPRNLFKNHAIKKLRNIFAHKLL